MTTFVPTVNNLIAVVSASKESNDPSPDLSSDAYLRLMLGPWKDLKRPWLVQSESNVRRIGRKLPDPPCTMCKGTGQITCKQCRGRGRTNFIELVMLPKGEWPNWGNEGVSLV
ncbi:hypothetical protein KP509_34G054700 [Ceratopteris richardii]|uniref:Uncharacterized protein n=1 Tax=Ceratopteris richardii TaxID=49495 RepID=A0A8T2QLK4_CERRI|nr:hypothetical protein KP509_34G054700 [Ceratopteris richardii]